MTQKPQREFLEEIDTALAGIRGLIATAMTLQQKLTRRQLKYIRTKIDRANYIAQDQIPPTKSNTTTNVTTQVTKERTRQCPNFAKNQSP